MKQQIKEDNLTVRNRYNLLEKITQVYCIFIFSIFPLVYGKKKYQNITITKFRWFWITACIFFAFCAGVLIYYLIKDKKAFGIRNNDIKFKVTLPQIFAVLFTLYNVVSAIASPYGKDTWIGQGRFEGLFSAIVYSAVFILVSFWGEYSDYYIKGSAISVAVFNLIAFLQMKYTGIMHPTGMDFWATRFMSTMGNVDMVGGYVSVFIPILFGAFVFTEDKRWNILELVDIFFLLYAFIVADVDSGKIGLLVALFVAFPFIFDTRRHIQKTLAGLSVVSASMALLNSPLRFEKSIVGPSTKKMLLFLVAAVIMAAASFCMRYLKKEYKFEGKTLRRVIFAVMIIAVIVGIVFVYNYNGGNRLIYEASEILHGRLSDDAGSGRGFIWKDSVKLIKEKPVLGYGPGTFFSAFMEYNRGGQKADYAHNDFLQIAVCAGCGALILYLCFVVSLCVRALLKAPKCPLIIIFGAACAGYLAHSFFSFSIAIITPMFWVSAGILDKLVKQVKD